MSAAPRLPEDPVLRHLAEVLEANGAVAEVYDHKWRLVHFSTEITRMMAISAEAAESYMGISLAVRTERYPEIWRPERETAINWVRAVFPLMLHDVPPGDPDFDEVFGNGRDVAARMEPAAAPALAATVTTSWPDAVRKFNTWAGDVEILYQRILGPSGSLLGVISISRPAISPTLAARLSRGERATLERIDRLSEPARRPAAILFADLEASGDLSRRLSSRAYFELIRGLTDLIDSSVTAQAGITGNHAGDGGSALFVAEDGNESVAALGAIAAAKAIREGAGSLVDSGDHEVRVNVGLHWGATLMVGQVSAGGRLEVTALGDEMNEAARIESVASRGAILCSKQLIERLDPQAAGELGLDRDRLIYRPVSELAPDDKAARDAGSIAVTEL
jgi:class 3 adenylate cyclase